MTDPTIPPRADETPAMSAEVTPRPSRKRLYVVLAAAAVIVLAGSGAGISLAVSASNAAAKEHAEKVALREQGLEVFRQARSACSLDGVHAPIGDNGTTLTLDGKGKGYSSAGLTQEELACVIVRLDTPSRITSTMEGTRALDGRQDDQWDTAWGTISVSWTYHPDNGLDLVYSSELSPELAALESE